MFSVCLLTFSACVVAYDIFRVHNATLAADNSKLDRILFPVAIAAAVIGMMAA